MSDHGLPLRALKAVFALAVLASVAGCEDPKPVPTDAMASDPMRIRAVGIIKNAKGQPICNALMIAPDMAATDKHCIDGGGQTITIRDKTGKSVTADITTLLAQDDAWVLANNNRPMPDFYRTDELKETIRDQVLVRTSKPIADEGAIMPVVDMNTLEWIPLDGTNLKVTDVSIGMHIRKGDTKDTKFLEFKCQLVASDTFDKMVVAHNCPTVPGSSGAVLATVDAKGKFSAVALHTGAASTEASRDPAKPGIGNIVGFEFILMLNKLPKPVRLDLLDMTGINITDNNRVNTALPLQPLHDRYLAGPARK